jgi:hypothetical protein
MGYLLAFAVIIGFFFYSNVKRGKRFVRAFVFINYFELNMDEGMSKEKAIIEANNMAIRMTFSKHSDPSMDRREAERARDYAATYFEGKQVPVISKARDMGFLG